MYDIFKRFEGMNMKEVADVISKTKYIIILIFNLILSIMTMVFIFALASKAADNDQAGTSLFLALSILSVVLYHVFLFFKYSNMKDRIRISIVSLIYIVAALFAFLAKDDYRFFYVSTFGVVLGIAASQILAIFIRNKEKTKAGIITNALFGIVLLALGVAVLLNINENNAMYITLIDVILLLLFSMKNIILPSLKFSKVKVFLDILLKTHTFDVLICLLAMIIAFSFLFPMFEDSITNYWDAMWYCFAVITTIGFGDFAAETAVGRILTVVLGIYGIVIVAILTSVIVNYYGAITKKEAKEEKYME